MKHLSFSSVLFNFLCFNVVKFAIGIYNCSTNDEIKLSLNQFAFFETSAFPSLWQTFASDDQWSLCNLTFNIQSNITDIKIYAVIKTYAYCIATDSEDNDWEKYIQVILLNKTVTFAPQQFFSKNPCSMDTGENFQNFVAFQGFVVFENISDNCPLEKASNPFLFTSESQIVILQSHYPNNEIRKKSCKWKFEAPDGYGFKIVITALHEDTAVFIKNTTSMIVNNRSALLFHPYYNNDRYIEVYLPLNNQNLENKLEFRADISLVKSFVNKTDGKCKTSFNIDGTLVWRNANFKSKGIANNIYCIYNLTIPSNMELYIDVNLFLELGVDFIQVFADNEMPVIFYESSQISFSSFSSNKNVALEFISDGSGASLMFELTFYFLKCECNQKEILCGSFFTLMGNNFNGYYCGHLNCTYKIQSCSTDLTLIQVVTSQANDMTFLSNNETVFTVNNFVRDGQFNEIYLNSDKNNILEIFTYPSSRIKKQMYIISRPFNIPPIELNITLTSDIKTYIIDTQLVNFGVVEISDSMKHLNLSIVVYSNFQYFGLYNNESLTYNLYYTICRSFWKCVFKMNKVAFFMDIGFPVMAIQLKGKLDGCIFENNVFILNDIFMPVVSLANNKSSCLITLLQMDTKFYTISYLWTTSVNENVQVFVGDNPNKLLFEFNAKTSHKWKNIVLASKFYTIKVPKNAAILLNIVETYTVMFPHVPFQSLISTPFLFTSFGNLVNTESFKYEIGNFSVKFTVIYFQKSYNEKIEFVLDNNGKIQLNSTGDSIVFENQNVGLNYINDEDREIENGALLFIESI